jgi:hypothetical protein
MFSPAEQQTGWVYGSPAIRPDMDRYKSDIWKRTNESPVEKVNVGPGIGLDYSVPAQGGFQQFTRILPNNVSDYKANQLEGRVKTGNWYISHPTSQYINGVEKSTADLTTTQARRPTMATGFYTSAPSASTSGMTDYIQSVSRGRQSRPDTEEGEGFGVLRIKSPGVETFSNDNSMSGACIEYSEAPLGKAMKSNVPMQTQDLQSYSSIRETFRRGSAGYSEEKGYWECLDNEQGSNRFDLFGPAKGGVEFGESRDGKYFNLTDRGEVNPFVINISGTVNGNGLWNPNTFQDNQRVTRKETTQYADAGNLTGNKQFHNTWEDNQRVTRKETIEYANNGNLTGSKQHTNTFQDEQRVTKKETNTYSFAGNPSQGGIAVMSRSMFDGDNIFVQ